MAKPEKTPADFIVIALSPVLIMALIGSLVFFLVEVLYVGQYQGKLLWILFLFVFGAVLVARIAIELDANRAALYGLVLAGVAWLGLWRYVEYPPGTFAAEFGWAISMGLIGVIWWSANRLTRDCTMIDDTEDASGAGLLQAAGLEEQGPLASTPGSDPAPNQEKKPKRAKRDELAIDAWWRRYRRYRDERRRKPQVPGVWVVYFSLAALPLYGLGQSLIPPAEVERRRYVFWLMSIYVASGLGLLLTTSFLGLRRYLRQKKVQMPVPMTGMWLLLGAALIAVFLVVGALLPRPATEYTLIDLPWRAGAKDREASRFAPPGDEPGKDEGRPAGKGKAEREGKGKDEAAGKNKGDKDKGDGSSAKQDKAPAGSSDTKDKAADKGAQKGKGSSNEKKSSSAGATQKPQTAKADDKRGPEQQGKPDAAPNPPTLPEWTAKLGAILKWIVLGAFALLIVFFLLRAVLMFLANFTGWAKSLLDFFRSLWRRVGGVASAAADPAPAAEAKPVPFRMFGDPFLTGQADRMSTADLIRYTFDALESWAAERGLPRRVGETPLEFAERLGEEAPKLEAEVRRLATDYAALAYARTTLTDDSRDPLRQLWLLLVETARRNVA